MANKQEINLSAVIIAQNEEANIGNALKSLDFCDEVIVIDDKSEDNTAKIAQKMGAKVFYRNLGEDFSLQRNFGLAKAKSRWILFVDADEIITHELQSEIVHEVTKSINYTSGYFFRRIDFVWGSKIQHGEVGDVRLLRLARRDAGRWERAVHEYWHVIGETKTFTNPILHYPHPTIEEFLREVNQRSTLHALANRKEGKNATLMQIIFYPLYKFIYAYVLRFGFLDGIVGFIIAMIMSLHSFLSWSKLWFLERS